MQQFAETALRSIVERGMNGIILLEDAAGYGDRLHAD